MSRDAVWDDWLSAEAYREYAEHYPLYQGQGPEPYPFQIELAAALMARLPGQRSTTERQFTSEGIKDVLERCRFRVERVERFRHVGRQQEFMELMQIPAMAARLQADLDPASGLQIVQAAAARSDPNLEVDVPWIYFVARRQ